MENTRLITLFNTLSSKELRAFRPFLAVPLVNKRPEVKWLFEYLVECQTLSKVFPTKEKAFQYIKKSGSGLMKYDDQKMRLWMSFLFKAIEKYLVQKNIFEDERKTKIALLSIYRERNLPKQQERCLQEIQKIQKQALIKNATFYDQEFQIELEKYEMLVSYNRMKETNLQKISDNLDTRYLIEKLRQSCALLSHQTVYKKEYDFGLLDSILKYIETNDLFEIPAIAIYYHCYQMLIQPTVPTYFQAFKKGIVNHGTQFPKEELGDIYLFAINNCIKRYNEGNRFSLEEMFELYQLGLEKDLFVKNKTLSRFTYRNIVTTGLILEEYEWTEKFIHQYKNKLDKKYRESMFSFNLARLEYGRKNYKEALLLLQKSPYKDLLLNLAAKTVMLKIFYELEEYDLLDAHIEAMRIFIRRKNIIGYHQENYLKLLQLTQKLKDRNPYDRSAIQAIESEINATQKVAEKEWLLSQARL